MNAELLTETFDKLKKERTMKEQIEREYEAKRAQIQVLAKEIEDLKKEDKFRGRLIGFT